MKEVKVRLVERIERAPSVESFRFMPGERIDFLPGQFLELILDPANRQNKGLNKYLSLSSSPTKNYIEVTKKLSDSEFSGRLKNMKKDDEALVRMPMGNCVFDGEQKKIAFLIGGIGITPVVSIIEYIMDKKLDTDIYLFYSNRTDEDIAFKKELDYWQSVNKNIKIYYTVTDCQPKDKTCLWGFINGDLIKENACDLRERTTFIYGPPVMVEAMCGLSLELECKRENIKTERFIGY